MVAFGIKIWVMAMSTIAIAEPDPAHAIPAPPDQMPWWGDMAMRFLEQYPEVLAWLVVAFVVLSAILTAGETILKAIADKTETDADNKALAYVSKLARWASKIMGWINAPKIKRDGPK